MNPVTCFGLADKLVMHTLYIIIISCCLHSYVSVGEKLLKRAATWTECLSSIRKERVDIMPFMRSFVQFMLCLYLSYAFIHYTDEEVCRKAHDSSQDLSYQNRTLVVMYGKKTPPPGSVAAATPADSKRKTPAKRKLFTLVYMCIRSINVTITRIGDCHLLCLSPSRTNPVITNNHSRVRFARIKI